MHSKCDIDQIETFHTENMFVYHANDTFNNSNNNQVLELWACSDEPEHYLSHIPEYRIFIEAFNKKYFLHFVPCFGLFDRVPCASQNQTKYNSMSPTEKNHFSLDKNVN